MNLTLHALSALSPVSDAEKARAAKRRDLVAALESVDRQNGLRRRALRHAVPGWIPETPWWDSYDAKAK
jgi:hypothetical protein